MQIVSVRDEPAIRQDAIRYFQRQWASADTMMMYDDAITPHRRREPLAAMVLRDGARLVGCAGLITNDFISRGELYPAARCMWSKTCAAATWAGARSGTRRTMPAR